MQKVMSDRQCMEKGLDNVLEAQMERLYTLLYFLVCFLHK